MKNMLRMAVAVVLAIALSGAVQAQEPLMDILRSELDYQYQKFSQTPAPPYYMSFRVTDVDVQSVSASFGVLAGQTDTHERVFKPQIRLGDTGFDNFRGEMDGMQGGQGRILLPLDDDNPDAIRQIIWKQSAEEYKASVEQLERLRAADKVNTKRDDKAPDYSDAPAEKHYEAPLAADRKAFDREELARRVKAYSALFLGNPDILNGGASVDFTVLRKYFVSTEGTEIVQNSLACRLMISGGVRTADGMELPLYKSYFAFTPAGLPDDETVMADVREIVGTLAEMKDAPIVDPYTGPAMLSGEAAGVFFHEIFGHRIEGQRMKSDSDGQTFKKMVGQSVLPKSFSVYDDPTLARFGGDDLYGYYLYDDQGVRARRVDVVKNGTLGEFLMTRVPTDEFGASNGHARGMEHLNPVSRQSNLVVESSNHLTEAQLRKLLIKEAKAQKKDFALYFKEVTGGFTMTGRYSPNSFNVTPLEVYKVWVDGRPDELVRGVDLIGTPLSMFSSIAEAGGETEIFTGVCGAESGSVPVTAVSPQILVRKVEVQRKAKSSNTPPVLSRPDEAAALKTPDEVIFRAMDAELGRSMDKLKMENLDRPFWIGYLYSDVRVMQISASLGETVRSMDIPQRFNSTRVVLGDYNTTSDIAYTPVYMSRGSAIETDGVQIRREFWLNTDASYKMTAPNMARKAAMRRQSARTPEEEALPDLLSVGAVTRQTEWYPFGFDRAAWEESLKRLSAIFMEYPSLYGTSVSMQACDWTNYAATTDGVRMKQPASFALVMVQGSVRTPDGEEFSDRLDIYAPSDLTLPTEDELREKIVRFAAGLSDYATAPKIEEFYSGPVLFTGQPVFAMFDRNLLAGNGTGLLVQRRAETPAGRGMGGGGQVSGSRKLENRLGQRVLDRRFTVVNHSTMREYGDTPLLGYYEIDADGITPPSANTVIENGMLRTVLNGRIPTLKSPASTGSNRFSAAINPYLAPGTLEVAATGGQTLPELEKQLVDLAESDGLACAYIVERMSGRYNLVWRIDVATGGKTLVRGAEVQPVGLTQLKRVAAVSDGSEARNYLAGQVPATMIYPSAVLLEDVEIGQLETTKEKPSPIVNPLERTIKN